MGRARPSLPKKAGARGPFSYVPTLGVIGSRGSVENSVQAEDEAALGRLRRAIAAEDGEGEEEQLKGVLRMLARRSPTRLSSPRFVGEHRPVQAPPPDRLPKALDGPSRRRADA
jgi:hypothetical protein